MEARSARGRSISSQRSSRGRRTSIKAVEAIEAVVPEDDASHLNSTFQTPNSKQKRSCQSTGGRRNTLIYYKDIQPCVSPQAIARSKFIQRETEQLKQFVCLKIKEGMIIRGHERSARKLDTVSNAANEVIEKCDDKIEGCRNDQRKFFHARKRIAEAACHQAKVHKIDMEMVDYDENEERSNYLNNTSNASTRWSSLLSETTHKEGSYVNKKLPAVPAKTTWSSRIHKDFSLKRLDNNSNNNSMAASKPFSSVRLQPLNH